MNMPGFTAGASLNKKGDYYVGPRGTPIMDDALPVKPASFAAIHHFPLPTPGPIDVCSACVGDCLHRGGNWFSCRNLCSFVCD